MPSIISTATDARQSYEWGDFLSRIGWQTTRIDKTYIFYRTFPLTNRTLLKIQHPKGPLPLKKIDIFAKKQKALFVIIEPHVEGFNENELTSYGYRISKTRFAHSATILLDLKVSRDKLFASFSENARRNIRKSQKVLNADIVSLDGLSDEKVLQIFYDLYKKLGATKHFYVPSFHEVSSKMRAFQKTSVLIFAYKKKDTERAHPVAVLWVGTVEKTLVYFHPANTEEGYRLLANYFLMWEAMLWGKKQGMQVFDLETAYDSRYPRENKQWKGYTEFKQKFRGEIVTYPPSYIKFYHSLAEALYRFGTLFSK